MSWGSLWLQNWTPPNGDDLQTIMDAWSVLSFAYIAGLPDAFAKAAWVLLLKAPFPLASAPPLPGSEFQNVYNRKKPAPGETWGRVRLILS